MLGTNFGETGSSSSLTEISEFTDFFAHFKLILVGLMEFLGRFFKLRDSVSCDFTELFLHFSKESFLRDFTELFSVIERGLLNSVFGDFTELFPHFFKEPILGAFTEFFSEIEGDRFNSILGDLTDFFSLFFKAEHFCESILSDFTEVFGDLTEIFLVFCADGKQFPSFPF